MTNLYSDSSYHNLCHTEEQQQFLFWIKEYNVSVILHIDFENPSEGRKDAIDKKIVSPDISHQARPKMCRLHGCAEHKLSSEQILHIQSENIF